MKYLTWKSLLLGSLATASPLDSASGTSLTVRTSIGTFQGIANTANGFNAWLGVPFAQPPIGNLRFRAPAAINRPFSGVQNATAFKAACPQPVGCCVFLPEARRAKYLFFSDRWKYDWARG